jgi:hypothetical protein
MPKKKKTKRVPPNASTAAVPTRPIFPTVLHFNNTTPDINANRACRRQHLLLSSSKLTFQLSSRRRLHPDGRKHGLKLHLNLQPQGILSLQQRALNRKINFHNV